MNAPFQTRARIARSVHRLRLRRATADMLRPVAVEHGWSPEKVNKGGLRNAVQSLSVSASPKILFVDLCELGDPLNDINALAEVCEPGTVVIAAGTGQRRAAVPRPRCQRHPGLSAEALHRRPAARHLRPRADDPFRPARSKRRPTSRTSWPPLSACAAASAHRRSPPRSPGCSARRRAARPRCSISTSISAPARWRSTSSPAAA